MVRQSAMFHHLRTSSVPRFPKTSPYNANQEWLSLDLSSFHRRDEGQCLQYFDCDALVAMAVYHPYIVDHSFIKHLLSTYCVSANRPGMEKEDEINPLQGDLNLVRMNRHVHN